MTGCTQPEFVGVWVTYFVNRTESDRAKGFFEEEKVVRILDQAYDHLPDAHIDLDSHSRPWVTDTVCFQELLTGSLPDLRNKVRSTAEQLGKTLRAGAQAEGLIGVSAIEAWVNKTPASIPQVKGSLVRSQVGDVTLDVQELATYEGRTSWGHALLTLPIGLDAADEAAKRNEVTRKMLSGLEAELVIPELLGHKVGWLRDQTLTAEVQDHIAHIPTAVLSGLRDVTEQFRESSAIDLELDTVVGQLVDLTETEALLAENLYELLIQLDHLYYHRQRGVVTELFEVYHQQCERVVDEIRRMLNRISRLNENLATVNTLVSVRKAEVQESILRQSQGILAVMAIAVASVALLDSDLILRIWNLIVKVPKASLWAALLVLWTRLGAIALLTFGLWWLLPKPERGSNKNSAV